MACQLEEFYIVDLFNVRIVVERNLWIICNWCAGISGSIKDTS